MRALVVAIAVVLTGAAVPAWADAQILTIQEQAQPSEPAPTQSQSQPESPGMRTAQPPAQAPDPTPAKDSTTASVPSRFSFQRVGDGFLRLDSTSGQIAFCSPHTVGWACQAVPEDRAALEKEIARLQGEVAGLQGKVASLQEEIARLREPPPPPRPPADVTPHADKDGGLKMPTDEDIARARAAIADAWRRLMDMMTDFKNDVIRKRQPDRTTL